MPLTPQLNDFLTCPICFNCFSHHRKPITLTCSHTCCSSCLKSLPCCPFDQTLVNNQLPENEAILDLISSSQNHGSKDVRLTKNDKETYYGVKNDDLKYYYESIDCIKQLAFLLKPQHQQCSTLSRPMQRKIITLIHCQIVDGEGRSRAMRNARSIGERALAEILIKHQDSHQLSSNLWAAVRARGCQFLGPAMQEEVLRLVLLALEDGSALSRKVLVMFVVQRLSPQFPHQASKTAIGHVIQLLYRASCFKLTKRDGDSSLMQLKEEYCSYEALRREHDTQIVSIALEAGLRISPDQWSSLLYGDTVHKSHMQSIIDKLQSPASFNQSIQELIIALQRTGDPSNLSPMKSLFEKLALIDPGPTNHESSDFPDHENLSEALEAAKTVTFCLVEFLQKHSSSHTHGGNTRTPRVSTPTSNRPRVNRVKPSPQSQPSPSLQSPFSPLTILSSPNRTIQRPCASLQSPNVMGIPTNLPSSLVAQQNTLHCGETLQHTNTNSIYPLAPSPVPTLFVSPNGNSNIPSGTVFAGPISGHTTGQPPSLSSEEDQFIPFADQPFVSKYGPISRIMNLINTPTMASSGNGMNVSGAAHNGLSNTTHSTNVILGRSAVPSLTLIQPLQQLVLTTTILTEPNTSYGNPSFVSDQRGCIPPDHTQDSSVK